MKKQKILGMFLLTMILMFAGCGKENSETVDVSTETIRKETAETDDLNVGQVEDEGVVKQEKAEIEFPYQLEEGVMIDALFQYSGMNPDCGDEEGENIGAIQLINDSEQYIESSEITMLMEDGTALVFQIEDVPSGNTVMAFDVNNTAFDEQQLVSEIAAEVSYAENSSLYEEEVTVSIEETGIYLGNQTENAIPNMTVMYHCDMDGVYFGGKSYKKQVELLESGESTVVSAEECYFGEATVVRIQY